MHMGSGEIYDRLMRFLASNTQYYVKPKAPTPKLHDWKHSEGNTVLDR